MADTLDIDPELIPPIARKRKTIDNFGTFCAFVLAYEAQLQKMRSSPHNSTGSSAGSDTTESTTSEVQDLEGSSSSSHSFTSPAHGFPAPARSVSKTKGLSSSDKKIKKEKKKRRKQILSQQSLETGVVTDDSLFERPDPAEHKTAKRRKRISNEVIESDDDWNLVTCFCQKPFAGRPMIECTECTIWIHLSCAKIRKSNVPEIFICQRCREARHQIRRSSRQKEENSSPSVSPSPSPSPHISSSDSEDL
ncbi:uncharacterized protein LOC144906214 [Branchiostoma floridae x Branchiostoma belcheri]